MAEGLVSRYVSADGSVVRTNAIYRRFVPIELATDPEEYKRRLRGEDEQVRKRARILRTWIIGW